MSHNNSMQHHPKDLVLDYYHCTLFLPLIGIDKQDFCPMESLRFSYAPEKNPDLAEAEEQVQAEAQETDAQAYLYFSPTLRHILFDFVDKKPEQQLTAIKEWRLKEADIKGWKLHLGEETLKNDPTKYQRSNIVSVRLLQYFNGIYLLAVRVVPEALAHLNYDPQQKQHTDHFADNRVNTLAGLCAQDPENAGYYQQLAMENWLRFTRHIRLLYPSFAQQKAENKIDPIHLIQPDVNITAFKEIKTDTQTNKVKIKIPAKPGQDFSQVMRAFLKAFANDDPSRVDNLIDHYDNLYDDRMFVSVAYGIAGNKLPDTSLQRINTLVSHIDRQEADGFSSMGGYAYTPEVILQKTAQHAFTLWQGLGGYYSYTDFSNSYLYNGEKFRTIMAPEHIPHIYDRMLTQALFYQASLRYYDQQICADTKILLAHTQLKTMRNQRKDFIEFTNQYWFHQLTTQMQGQEIFSLQQKALGLRQHYDILKDELECTDEYLQTEHEIKLNKTADRFARFGLMFALIALYYTALPIVNNVLAKGSWTWINQGWAKYIQMDLGSAEIMGLVTLLVMIPLLPFALLMILSGIGKLVKRKGK